MKQKPISKDVVNGSFRLQFIRCKKDGTAETGGEMRHTVKLHHRVTGDVKEVELNHCKKFDCVCSSKNCRREHTMAQMTEVFQKPKPFSLG